MFRSESISFKEQNDVVLDIFWKLKQLSPDEYAQVKRKKRTGLITLILGWGIFSNLHNINVTRDFWVIFRSPRVTFYTGHTFGFNVNISYLYSVKP